MKRIAIAAEYPTVNGGENSMLAVLKHLAIAKQSDREFEFCILAPSVGAFAKRAAEIGIEIVDLRLVDADGGRLPRDQAIFNILEAASGAEAHLLHGNSLSMGRLLGATSKRDSNIVSTSHLRDIMKLSNTAISDLNANRKLIAVSEATLAYHIEQGLAPDVGCVIHNGIDIDDFTTDSSAGQAVRRELGIADDAVVLLTVGQIGLRKGLDTLTEAAKNLAQSRSGIHWLLAGERFSQKSESLAYEANVLREFSFIKPDVRLHRLGYRSDIPALMQASDILVHAARQEPLGRVLLEAAASGLPIVATDVGGTSEILTDQLSALLVPVDSPEAIFRAVTELIDNTELRKRLASAAKKKIRDDFGVHQSATALLDVWRSALHDD